MNKKIVGLFLVFALSANCFAQWTQVNNGIANLSQGATTLGHSANYIFSGTHSGGKMYRSNDNGNNWSEITPPIVSNVPECGYYFNGKYFSGLNASTACIYYSSNDGTSWSEGAGSPTATVVRGFIGVSSDLFAYTSNKGIYKSSDGGINWTQINSGLSNLNVSFMEVINNKLIATTIGGGNFVSMNNGSTWVQSNTGIPGSALNGTFVWRMGSDLYYYEQGGGSYQSANDGATWTTWVKPTLFGLGINEIYRKGANLYLESRHFSGGLKDSVYVTSNEGTSWTNITGNLSATDLNAGKIMEFNGYAFIAYNLMSPNAGIYRRGVTVGINEQTSANTNIFVYPNPTANFINVKTDTKISGMAYTIFNQSGQQILTGKIVGENLSVDLNALSASVYFLQVGQQMGQPYKVIKE